ncbi:fibroblast growth factor receptor homolog 1 [Pangasianodon hypophthalmus]|uniref:fibroblast growth factor receptor homolog 1 n=1 Tax=Pangasianodon hypophthalmus TaxID=310915 RepID=UPI00230725F0|nr:fibroblast growth factor receptor homolog 1 [Pangasianodon hypophthalmus]
MSCSENSTNSSNHQTNAASLDTTHHILIGISVVTILTTLLFGILWFKKYRSLNKPTQQLGQGKFVTVPSQDSPPLSHTSPQSVLVMPPLDNSSETRLNGQKNRQSVRLLWRPSQQNARVSRTDLNLIQLIKAGREGAFYKAKMLRGTCKGHSLVTCKIAKEGVTSKQMETEVSVMRKLVYHKNVLQLLDWNTAEEPFMLIMEFVSYGTLRSFVQTHHDKLRADPEIQNLFTIASYHIALAMEHLRSKMVVHCDLALRNILVSRFPWEIKVAEFGLARDLTRMRSRRSTRKKLQRERVPLRWYPPEYFRNSYYSFKGDVWAFGIVLWEMQTFGSLPYPNLETSDQVVYHICAGTRNVGPDSCRPEILQIMKDCWLEPYTARPSFTELVSILENIIENDSDYVDVSDQRPTSTAED